MCVTVFQPDSKLSAEETRVKLAAQATELAKRRRKKDQTDDFISSHCLIIICFFSILFFQADLHMHTQT